MKRSKKVNFNLDLALILVKEKDLSNTLGIGEKVSLNDLAYFVFCRDTSETK